MTKQIAFLLIIALRLMYNPAKNDNILSAFAKPQSTISTNLTVVPAENMHRAGSSERLILKWIIGDNRPATCSRPVNEFYDFDSNAKHSFGVKLYKRDIITTSII